ncbi:MAG: hypothetical protein WDA60_01500 [Acidimicrobiia bacterium]|jgi:hypothetical protein
MKPRGRRVRNWFAGGFTAAALVVTASGPAGAAAVAKKGPDPATWTTRVCTQMVDFQAAALDAHEALWTATATPPADRAAQKATVKAFRTALAPVRARLTTLDRTLGRAAPTGRKGVAARDVLRDGLAPVGDAFATAQEQVGDLRTVPTTRFPRATSKVLLTLDRSIDRATKPLTRAGKTVGKSSVGPSLSEQAICRAVGFEWSVLATSDGADVTPPPPATTPDVPGSADLVAPKLLLPGRYRPPAEIASLAAQTAMTGRSRTFFYGAMPAVETGTPFATDCPAADAANSQILGCFHDGRIYVLAVNRPELARVVMVTAAHEMLHAVYDALPADTRADADAMTSSYFVTTTDERLKRIVAQYDLRAPANRPNELHSLIPTQVPTLTPELDAYYAPYFRDRGPVLAAYDEYISVFEGLISQYDGLKAQLEDLRARIADLRSQSDGAAGEANRLAGQIDALRAQGRFAESNTLVGPQNAAVSRAQSLNAAANGLVAEYNAVVDQINAVAAQLGGLESALRPLG